MTRFVAPSTAINDCIRIWQEREQRLFKDSFGPVSVFAAAILTELVACNDVIYISMSVAWQM